MIHYFIQPNGSGTAFMVTADSQEEMNGELWSLQNKGVAIKADMISDRSFTFLSSKKKLFNAFVLQFIHKNWMDDEMCELYKGEPGGFYADARKYAREKFAMMRGANWLFAQRSLPEIYSCGGKIKAEKDSGEWKDTLTTVLRSA